MSPGRAASGMYPTSGAAAATGTSDPAASNMCRGCEPSSMYDRILLPSDAGDAGGRAVDQAIRLARETGAELHLLFVVEEVPHAPEMVEQSVEKQLRSVGESVLAGIRDRAEGAGLSVETTVREGVPHVAIVDYADEVGADVIVMGTHGRSGLNRYLLGSVTERVVRTAGVPVLTVRIAGDDGDGEGEGGEGDAGDDEPAT